MKIVMLSASWCPACLIVQKRMKTIQEIIARYPFEMLDIDFDEEKTAVYKVGKTLPVFIVLDDEGNEIRRTVGERTALELKEEVFHD
ncbi:MAG: thioredoxin family protein [Erysipelotrichaceae bacterium]